MENTEKASKTAHEAADKVAQTSHQTADNVAQTSHQVADKVAQTSYQATEALCEKGEQLRNAEQRMLKNCEEYIRENPVTSVGLAVAAGFLLSLLLSER